MLWFSLSLILFTILIITAIQIITVRFTRDEEIIIGVDAIFFKLIFYPSRKSGRKKRSVIGFKSKFKKTLSVAAATSKAMNFLLSRSNLTIHNIDVVLRTDDPANYAVKSQNIYSAIILFLTYLNLKMATISTEDDIFLKREKDFSALPTLDFTISTSIWVLLFALAKYYLKAQEVKRIVGK